MKFRTKISAAFVLTLLTLFFSCGKNESVRPPDARKDSTELKKNDTEAKNNPDTRKSGTEEDGIKNLTYEIKNLPRIIEYTGKVVAGATWSDKNGNNVMFITETEEKKQKEDFRMKELYAYQYIWDADPEPMQLWKVNDFIKDCPVDITLSFLLNSLTVTDLDKNGIAENTFMYKMSCKGDVSPDDMKLIMHEGASKYAIRGSMILEMEGQKYGGEMKPDASFDKAPMEFLPYAKDQWDKFKTEKLNN